MDFNLKVLKKSVSVSVVTATSNTAGDLNIVKIFEMLAEMPVTSPDFWK